MPSLEAKSHPSRTMAPDLKVLEHQVWLKLASHMPCLCCDCIWVSTCISYASGMDNHSFYFIFWVVEQGCSSSPVFPQLFQYSHCHLGIVSVGKHTLLHTCAETQQVFLLSGCICWDVIPLKFCSAGLFHRGHVDVSQQWKCRRE